MSFMSGGGRLALSLAVSVFCAAMPVWLVNHSNKQVPLRADVMNSVPQNNSHKRLSKVFNTLDLAEK